MMELVELKEGGGGDRGGAATGLAYTTFFLYFILVGNPNRDIKSYF